MYTIRLYYKHTQTHLRHNIQDIIIICSTCTCTIYVHLCIMYTCTYIVHDHVLHLVHGHVLYMYMCT